MHLYRRTELRQTYKRGDVAVCTQAASGTHTYTHGLGSTQFNLLKGSWSRADTAGDQTEAEGGGAAGTHTHTHEQAFIHRYRAMLHTNSLSSHMYTDTKETSVDTVTVSENTQSCLLTHPDSARKQKSTLRHPHTHRCTPVN